MSLNYRLLGKTKLRVSEIGFGAWAIGGHSDVWGYGPTIDRISMKAVETALELGCNFFDTADCYGTGRSENILGSILSSNRFQVIITTKSGFDFYHGPIRVNFHPAYIRFAVHQSLQRLKTDYLDVFLLHNPPRHVLTDDLLVNELEKLRRSGAVRYIGVSVADLAAGYDAVNAGWPEVIQVAYNMLDAAAGIHLIPLAKEKGIGIIAREPLANGFLTGKFSCQVTNFAPGDIRRLWPPDLVNRIIHEVKMLGSYRRNGETPSQLALRFILESPGVSTAICGCKTPAQVNDNFKALKGFD